MRNVNARAFLTFVALLAPSLAMGTDTTSLVLDPLAPNTIYAGTANKGVYKSSDGGATWSPHGLGNTAIGALVMDPGSTPSLYALTETGVLKNSTEGDSWNPVLMNEDLIGILPYDFPIFGTAGTLAIAPRIDAATPGVLYVGVTSRSADVFTEYVWGEVYGSSNGGSSWWLLLPEASGDPWAFPEWPAAPVLGAAGASALASATIYTSGSFECDLMWFYDWGPAVSLCPRSSNGSVGASAIVADPERPEIVYYGTRGSGVYKTTDVGVSWTGGGSGFVNSLAIDPFSRDIIYAGTDDLGVLKSTDGAATWRAVNAGLIGHIEALGLPTGIRAVAVDPIASSTMYAATAAGVFKSTDRGENWSPTGLFQQSALASISVSPVTVVAGDIVTGTIHLSAPAPAGGAIVTLASTNAAVTSLPASVSVDAGGTSADFAIETGPAGVSATVTISATLDDAIRSATIHVVPVVRAVSLQRSRIAGGLSVTGTVWLSFPAPSGGVTTSLSSSDAAIARVPETVTVPAGAESANFTVSTGAVAAPTTVLITAAYGAETRRAALEVVPTSISSLRVDPGTVSAGGSAIGTVTMSVPAPPSGTVVNLRVSGSGVVTVPASINVPAGATSTTFVVSTSTVLPPTYSQISASITAQMTFRDDGFHASLIVRLPAVTISALSVNPASVPGGTSANATVMLNAPAPAGGALVAVSGSNSALASVPASVTVPAGSTSVSFPISTKVCTAGSAVFSGSYGGVTRSAELTVTISADALAIQVADYYASKRQLRVEATSSRPTATLKVYETASGQLIGTLPNLGGGKYSGQFSRSVNPLSITVRSSQCGSATRAVRKRS